MRISTYVIGAPLSDRRFTLLLHGLRGSLDKVPASVGNYLVDHRGRNTEAPPWNPGDEAERHLQERGYLTDLSVEEERLLMVDMAAALHEADLASSPPSFCFVPAYTCNLRCPYCFQSHEMHAGKGSYATIMTRERVDDAFRVIDRFDIPGAIASELGMCSPTQPSAHDPERAAAAPMLGLFGGEPLDETTRDIVEYIAGEARTRGSALWAITNGVQLDLFADLLGPGGLAELQITLDGMPELHDRRRVGPRFRETFHRIVANIDLALEAGAQVKVRINVDSSNVDHVAMLNDLFAERGWLGHPSFSAGAAVVTGEAKHEPLVSHADLVQLTSTFRGENTNCVNSYEHYAMNTLVRALSSKYPFQRVAHCAAETGLLMFDPRGDLYGCWEEIGLADRRIGHYRGGNLTLDQEAARTWLSRFPGSIEQCSRCPYALIHTSGCGNHARNDSGTLFAAACEGFQTYFPHTLAESYTEIEQQLLDGPLPTRRHLRRLPLVQVTNGRAATAEDGALL
ncbi:radical SAM protein [Streptomyces sp. NPDC000351]|uniref:radical SAM/SPASM domain-containing protein n=1 Tax=Streptomyces sp. NPDC000351 TaxID=3154250 RepID=UPI00331EBC56